MSLLLTQTALHDPISLRDGSPCPPLLHRQLLVPPSYTNSSLCLPSHRLLPPLHRLLPMPLSSHTTLLLDSVCSRKLNTDCSASCIFPALITEMSTWRNRTECYTVGAQSFNTALPNLKGIAQGICAATDFP